LNVRRELSRYALDSQQGRVPNLIEKMLTYSRARLHARLG
jgi:hypothetical protein